MSRPEPRIGDAERDRAVQALSDHYVAGRLTKEEYDERSDSVLGARTASDLRPLFADLPSGHPLTSSAPAAAPRAAAAPARRPAWTRPPVLLLAMLLLPLAAVAFIADEFWLVFVVGGFLLWSRGGCGSRRRTRWHGR